MELTVYVFTVKGGATVNELLAKYDANNKPPRYLQYTKDEFIMMQREAIADIYTSDMYHEYQRNPEFFMAQHNYNPELLEKLKVFELEWLNGDSEKIYDESIKYCNPEYLDEDGNIYNTANPYARFSSYRIERDSIYNNIHADEVDLNNLPQPDAYVDIKGNWYYMTEAISMHVNLRNAFNMDGNNPITHNVMLNVVKCVA